MLNQLIREMNQAGQEATVAITIRRASVFYVLSLNVGGKKLQRSRVMSTESIQATPDVIESACWAMWQRMKADLG